jgi:hypothetical protein
MAQATRPCKGCGELIYRTRPRGEIPRYCSSECGPRCTVDGCEKPRHGKVYCSVHRGRWVKYGDPLAPLVRQPNVGTCTIEGCDQPMRKRTWCASHYAQWHSTGMVAPFVWKWGSGGYGPTHARLSRIMGPASAQSCVDCGDPAAEWSYSHNDPDEMVDKKLGPYTYKTECYSPRCVLCHRRFDRKDH